MDRITEHDVVAEAVRSCPLPQIVTCRPTWEGGQCELREEERLALLFTAVHTGATYVDVEFDTYRRDPRVAEMANNSPREMRSGLIVSYHDFRTRSPRFLSIFEELAETLGYRQDRMARTHDPR